MAIDLNRLGRAAELLVDGIRAGQRREPAWHEWATVDTADPLWVVLDSDITETPVGISANTFGPVEAGMRVRVEHIGNRTNLVAAPSVIARILPGVSDDDWVPCPLASTLTGFMRIRHTRGGICELSAEISGSVPTMGLLLGSVPEECAPVDFTAHLAAVLAGNFPATATVGPLGAVRVTGSNVTRSGVTLHGMWLR